MSDCRRDLNRPGALVDALHAIGVASASRPPAAGPPPSDPAAVLATVRGAVDERRSVAPLEPERRWPPNRPALVVAPDARSVVAVARTGRNRSLVVTAQGRRRRVANRRLLDGGDSISTVFDRVGRTFAAMRREADPAHAPVVLTFPALSGVGGTRLQARLTLAGFVALTIVATVTTLASWGFAFAAVESQSSRVAGLLVAVAAAAVAAIARGASTTLASRVASAWSLRMRGQLAEKTLAADPRRTRAAGELKLLVSVGEAENVDATSIETALSASGGVVSLAAAVLLAVLTFPAVLVPLLVAWIAAVALGAWRYDRANQALVDARRRTGSWVAEQLRAHETRWVQHPEADFGAASRSLAGCYEAAARRADRSEWFLSFAAPGIGLAVTIAAVGMLAVTTDPDTAVVAAALAAALVGYQSVTAVANGLAAATRVAAARRAALDLLPAADRAHGISELGPSAELERKLREPDARVAITGPTGSGKTRLLAALTRPDAWARAAHSPTPLSKDESQSAPHSILCNSDTGPPTPVLVPAFGDNFMFRESLAFNLLIGRGWPATPNELCDAEQVARSVGLADLIDRMPLGIQTPVGETGWQLSNGERTMVFLARALLAGDRPLLLDDGLDAIDAARRLLVADALAAHGAAVVATTTSESPTVAQTAAGAGTTS